MSRPFDAGSGGDVVAAAGVVDVVAGGGGEVRSVRSSCWCC